MTALPSPEDFTEIVAGWTGEKKAVFLDHLAQSGNVRGACARVGMSREAAYRLRRRDADFARGWGAAMVLANHAGTELLASCATEGTEHRVYFHGELVDTYRRIDARLLLAHLGRLDKAADDKRAQVDAGRFDELLAVIAGADVPEELQAKNDILPIDREQLARERAVEFQDALEEEFERQDEEGDELSLEIDEIMERKEEREGALAEASARGRAEGLRLRDAWSDGAHDFVDRLLGRSDAAFLPRTVSDVSTCALAAGLAAASPLPPPQLADSATSG